MAYRPSFGEFVVVLACAGDPEPMLTTWGFGNPIAPTVTDCNTLGVHFKNDFDSHLSGAYTIVKVAARWQQSADEQVYVESTGTLGGFTGAITALPPNCAYICQKKTTRAGRKGRGRCFLPGVPEGNVDSTGALTTPTLVNMNQQVDSWYTHCNSVFDELVIHHMIPYVEGVPGTGQPDPAQIPTNIVSLEVPVRIGTQRRRMKTRTFPTV